MVRRLMPLFLALALLGGAACANGKDFGGPYPRDGNDISVKKIGAFWVYHGKGLFFTEGTELTRSLLEDSISNYITTAFPYATSTQMYNYVVDKGKKIIVAIWKTDLDYYQMRNYAVICNKGGNPGYPPAQSGLIVNFYSETLSPPESPCKFSLPNEPVPDGLLDASSKHFMLAQGMGRTIASYEPDKWTRRQVAYAGVIVVGFSFDDQGNLTCKYSLDANSGTYKPYSGTPLQKVEDLFDAKLGVPVAQAGSLRCGQ